MPAICTWCSGLDPMASRCGFVCRWTARRRIEDGGVDVDQAGNGAVSDYRLYQLIRQKGTVEDRTFRNRVPRPGRPGICVHLRLKAAVEERGRR